MIVLKINLICLLTLLIACNQAGLESKATAAVSNQNTEIVDYAPDHNYSDAFYKEFYKRFNKAELAKMLNIPMESIQINGSLSAQEYVTQIRGKGEESYDILLLREDSESEVAGLYLNIEQENKTFEEGGLKRFIQKKILLKVPGNIKAYWSDHWGTLTVFLHQKRVMVIRTLTPAKLMSVSDAGKAELEKNSVQLATYYLRQF